MGICFTISEVTRSTVMWNVLYMYTTLVKFLEHWPSTGAVTLAVFHGSTFHQQLSVRILRVSHYPKCTFS